MQGAKGEGEEECTFGTLGYVPKPETGEADEVLCKGLDALGYFPYICS